MGLVDRLSDMGVVGGDNPDRIDQSGEPDDRCATLSGERSSKNSTSSAAAESRASPRSP